MNNLVNLYESGNKANKIITNGEGNKFLSDNGEYKEIKQKVLCVATIEDMNKIDVSKFVGGELCVVNKVEEEFKVVVGENLKNKTIRFKDLNSISDKNNYYNVLIFGAKNSEDEILTYIIDCYNKYGLYKNWDTNNTLVEYDGTSFSENEYQEVITDDFIVTRIYTSNNIYDHTSVISYNQHIFRYNTTEWVDIEISPSTVNGYIKKGDEEINVYIPNRENRNELLVDDENHTITLTQETYDAVIDAKTYRDDDGVYNFYDILFDDYVKNNISNNFRFCLNFYNSNNGARNDEGKVGYKTLKINGIYNNVPMSWISDTVNSPLVYFNKEGRLHINTSIGDYYNYPYGLKRFSVELSSGNLYTQINNDIIKCNSTTSSSSNRAFLMYYCNIKNINYETYSFYGSSINSIISDYSENHSGGPSLYAIAFYNNEETLSDTTKTLLDSLNCSRYKNVKNLTDYIAVIYEDTAIEFINDEVSVGETISFLLDYNSESIFSLKGGDSNNGQITSNVASLTNRVTTNETNIATLQTNVTTINNNITTINTKNLQEGLLWMGKLDDGTDSEGNSLINFSKITRVDVDKISNNGGSLTVNNNVLTFKAPYSKTYAFRGRVNLAETSTNGLIRIDIGSGYLIKETNVSTTGGDTKLLYQNIPMIKDQTINISVYSDSIAVSNIFFEIYGY